MAALADPQAPRTRGAIFSAHSVGRMLARAKTETRRALAVQPPEGTVRLDPWLTADGDWQYERGRPLWVATGADGAQRRHGCPYGKPGDTLYVKEGFLSLADAAGYQGAVKPPRPVAYRADEARDILAAVAVRQGAKWRSPLFMPRRAARLSLRLTGVRAERLHDITEAGALADGGWAYGACPIHKAPVASYRELWNELNAARGLPWETNCWVWVIAFEVAGDRPGHLADR